MRGTKFSALSNFRGAANRARQISDKLQIISYKLQLRSWCNFVAAGLELQLLLNYKFSQELRGSIIYKISPELQLKFDFFINLCSWSCQILNSSGEKATKL